MRLLRAFLGPQRTITRRSAASNGLPSRLMPEAAEEDEALMDERGALTVRDAGRLGGRRLLEKYGREHFAALGHKVGTKLREERGVEFFRNMAQAGGQATAATHDHEYYSNLGRQGGEKLKATRGKDYYRQIGRMGALSPKRRPTDPASV